MTEKLDSLQSRLKYARKKLNLTQYEVARRSGLKQPSYSVLEVNKNNAGSKFLPAIAKVLCVDVNWLLYGHDASEVSILSSNPISQLVTIPVIEPHVEPETGKVSLDKILKFVHLSPNILKNISGKVSQVKFLEVHNNSMSPVLNVNDLVGFDPNDSEVKDGDIYLILFEGEFMFRQIFKESGGFLTLSSMNKNSYPNKCVHTNTNGLKVIGKQCFRLG